MYVHIQCEPLTSPFSKWKPNAKRFFLIKFCTTHNIRLNTHFLLIIYFFNMFIQVDDSNENTKQHLILQTANEIETIQVYKERRKQIKKNEFQSTPVLYYFNIVPSCRKMMIPYNNNLLRRNEETNNKTGKKVFGSAFLQQYYL